ncbi:hypothetical protein TNCV_2423151 [Trichonephila clavipes]|nr:hypothetical protein TNCV_2423151 [Trichonephila clavipes]
MAHEVSPAQKILISGTANKRVIPARLAIRPVCLMITFPILLSPSSGMGGGGRVSLVVKVPDSWPVCYELEPSGTEDPPCRALMHVKSVGAQTSSRWCLERMLSSLLDHGSNSRGTSPKALV